MKTAACLWIGSLLLWAGCAGGGGAVTPSLGVQITSHQDRQTVAGTITLAGLAEGGPVEVAVDDQAFVPAEGGSAWSIELDTDLWSYGFHTIQARVRQGASQAIARISLFCEGGTQPPPSPPPSSGPQPPIVSDLVALWSFDDCDGIRAIDGSGNGLTGTIYGSALPILGKRKGGLAFDGVDDVVRIPDAQSPPPAAVADLSTGTISLWLRYDSIYNGNTVADILPVLYLGSDETSTIATGFDCAMVYIGHGNLVDPNQRQVYFTILKGDHVIFCLDTGKVSLEEDTWYHYAFVMGPGGNKLYVDGKEVTPHYTVGSPRDNGPFLSHVSDRDLLVLGYGMFGLSRLWWHLDGALDDVAVYDRVLTAAEIASLAAD